MYDLHPYGTIFCIRKFVPGFIFGRFLPKFLAVFEKESGHTVSCGARNTPKSPDIVLIPKDYPTTILDVRELSKSFCVNSRKIFDIDFSSNFFPMKKPSQKHQNFNFIIKYFWRWYMFKMFLKVVSSCFLLQMNVFLYGYHFSTTKIHCSTINQISWKLAQNELKPFTSFQLILSQFS